MSPIKGKAGYKIGLIIVLLIIGILFAPVVSAGSNVVTSSTGKLIVTPWESTQTQTYCGNIPNNLVTTSSHSHQTVGIASSPPDYNIQPDYNTASKCLDTGSQFPFGLTMGGWGTNLHVNDTGSNPTIIDPTNSYPSGIIINFSLSQIYG